MAALMMQTTNAVVEVHHLQLEKAGMTASTLSQAHSTQPDEVSHHQNDPDCNHCCHCHKIKTFKIQSDINSRRLAHYFRLKPGLSELIVKRPPTTLYRPPKIS